MRLRLEELQESDKKACKIMIEGLKDDYKEIEGVLHYQRLSFVPKII